MSLSVSAHQNILIVVYFIYCNVVYCLSLQTSKIAWWRHLKQIAVVFSDVTPVPLFANIILLASAWK